MGGIIVFVLVVVGLVVGVPYLFKMQRNAMEKALDEWYADTGEDVELEKMGVPPLSLWLKNRKGDAWARVRFPDGTVQWARLRRGLFAGKRPLVFFDP